MCTSTITLFLDSTIRVYYVISCIFIHNYPASYSTSGKRDENKHYCLHDTNEKEKNTKHFVFFYNI